MNLTLRQLKVFVTVYELGSFSAAANAVQLTQSAVSKICAELEEQIGFPLFERSSRKVIPAYGAADLYSFACEMLGILEATKRSMSSLAKMDRGIVKVAASPMTVHCLIAPAISEFRAAHPNVHFELFEHATRQTVEQVIDGKVDFGITSLDKPHDKLTVETLFDDHMFAVMHREHPLVTTDSVSWQTLSLYDHISMRSDFSIRGTIDRIAEQQQLRLQSTIEIGSIIAMLGMVKCGLGLAILPGYVIPTVKQMGLEAIPITGIDLKHNLSLITRWNARPSIAARTFMSLLRTQLSRPRHIPLL